MGRPRKMMKREPNGRPQREAKHQIEEAERAREQREMAVVLSQPHRRGSRSQLRENAIGRFVEDMMLPMALYFAAQEYASTKRRWLAEAKAPMPDRLGGSGEDVPPEVFREWGDSIKRDEDAMRDAAGTIGMVPVVWMAFDGFDCPPNSPRDKVVIALVALARAHGWKV